jgi:hypothetical protein
MRPPILGEITLRRDKSTERRPFATKIPRAELPDPALAKERAREIEQQTNMLLVYAVSFRSELKLSQRQHFALRPTFVETILTAASLARALTDREYLDFMDKFDHTRDTYYRLHDEREARLTQIEGAAGDNSTVEDLPVEDELEELKKILTRLPIRKDRVSRFIAAIERDVENADRATWKPPKGKPDPFPDVRDLTAPLFIKSVWRDKIKNGRIFRETIGGHDKDLLQAYDVYVSARRTRGVDLGDAKGLTLVSARKPKKTPSP